MSEHCPTCGQRVSVSTTDEGTSCYVGEEYNAAIEDAAKKMESDCGDKQTEGWNRACFHHAALIRRMKKEAK